MAQSRKTKGARASARLSGEEAGVHAVDRHVGARIKGRRLQVGISQVELGKKVGVSFQQIQKYERGANRVSASTLHDIAGVLNVSVPFFFDGLPLKDNMIDFAPTAHRRTDYAATVEGKRLLDVFLKISPALRASILRCLTDVAEMTAQDGPSVRREADKR